MYNFRLVLLILGIAVALLAGCKSEPVRPVMAKEKSVQAVALIHVSGLAPLLMPAMDQVDGVPTIRALRETGVVGQLNGGVPVAFAGTTTSMLTGKSTKDQGVDFWFFQDEEKNILHGYESGHIRVKTVLQMLKMRGLPTLSVFWPVTHPALHDSGDIVSPGPILDRQRIDDYAFVPNLSTGLSRRCSHKALCETVDSIFTSSESDQEILRRFSMADEFSDPLASAVKDELVQCYRADFAAMEIFEKLWTDEHRFVAINLVGADLLGRRLYGQFDSKNFRSDEKKFKSLGRILVKYYRFIDGFIKRVQNRIGDRGVIIIVSDHGMGPAPPMDSKRSLFPGRAHPVGLCIIHGAGIQVGRNNERFMPYHLTPLILNLLGQPMPKDGKQNISDRILSGDNFDFQSAPLVPSYENGKGNPSPSVPFGTAIGAQERYTRFGEIPPPLAH